MAAGARTIGAPISHRCIPDSARSKSRRYSMPSRWSSELRALCRSRPPRAKNAPPLFGRRGRCGHCWSPRSDGATPATPSTRRNRFVHEHGNVPGRCGCCPRTRDKVEGRRSRPIGTIPVTTRGVTAATSNFVSGASAVMATGPSDSSCRRNQASIALHCPPRFAAPCGSNGSRAGAYKT
jgi:hypothetical protein